MEKYLLGIFYIAVLLFFVGLPVVVIARMQSPIRTSGDMRKP